MLFRTLTAMCRRRRSGGMNRTAVLRKREGKAEEQLMVGHFATKVSSWRSSEVTSETTTNDSPSCQSPLTGVTVRSHELPT